MITVGVITLNREWIIGYMLDSLFSQSYPIEKIYLENTRIGRNSMVFLRNFGKAVKMVVTIYMDHLKEGSHF